MNEFILFLSLLCPTDHQGPFGLFPRLHLPHPCCPRPDNPSPDRPGPRVPHPPLPHPVTPKPDDGPPPPPDVVPPSLPKPPDNPPKPPDVVPPKPTVDPLIKDLIDRVSKLEANKPKDGKNGVDGKNGKDGTNGKDGAGATVDPNAIATAVVTQLKPTLDGFDKRITALENKVTTLTSTSTRWRIVPVPPGQN